MIESNTHYISTAILPGQNKLCIIPVLADEAITIKLLPLGWMPVTLYSSDTGSGANELKSAITGIVANNKVEC